MEQTKTIVVLGTVWPEPTSSAAGTRIIQLLQLFKAENYTIYFACTAKKSPYSFDLLSLGVIEHEIELNNSSFDHWIQKIKPKIVLYDRFMLEEQFGWRIRENCPNTLQILDTEDLHFLRVARQKFKKQDPLLEEFVNLEITQREIAAILRCDLSLLISKTEMELLLKQFSIPPFLLYYLPFLECKISTKSAYNSFESRNDFVFIGNFLHPPNFDSIIKLKQNIWPQISASLPNASIHVYGAYVGEKVKQLHNEKQRFIIKGRAENAIATLSNYKVLLAPLSFGAGIKGKILDAVKAGTPFLTSTIGAEGLPICGTRIENFAQEAVKIYTDKEVWLQLQTANRLWFNEMFDKEQYEQKFMLHIEGLLLHLKTHRAKNIFGKILQREAIQSTKYLSKWIEQKNKN